ncbi:REP-associated tyrosine transposase [Salinisphaera hydrothermalis]|uniref:REP-associated tyrosine transposase n=1 Tax=Salinisphaera hydrothermalis TaxID=563188 RepID=UPI003340FF38
MRYRRAYQDGGCYFFTVVTARRRAFLTEPSSIAALRDAFRRVRSRYPFTIDAVVILPDHLHCVWTLPADDADFSLRWRLIKTAFSKRAGIALPCWQPRFWEHQIRDATDYAHHLDYIHYNPVRHGYVERVADWPHSSFGRCVQAGLYPPDWGIVAPALPVDIGRE